MAVPVGIIAASALAPVIGGVVGNIMGGGQRAAAARAMAEAEALIRTIGAGPDLARKIILKGLNDVGVLTPEMEEQVNIGISEVSKIKEESLTRDAQISALEDIKTSSRTGFGPQDRAALNKMRSQLAQDNQAKLQQIGQNALQRGQSGSGAELAAQIATEQSGANRAAMQGEELAAIAGQRAMEAIVKSADIGNAIRGQDFSIAKDKASAADAFKQFDVQNQINRQQRNVGSRNAASDRNLTNKQRISDYNITQENNELRRQRDAEQTMHINRSNWINAMAGAKIGQAAQMQQAGQNTASMWSGIGSGLGQAASAYGNYQSQQAANDLAERKLALQESQFQDQKLKSGYDWSDSNLKKAMGMS